MATINGTSGNDELFGSAIADTISGFEGSDQIFGGGGNDILTGGLGADVAIFEGNHGDFKLALNANGLVTVAYFFGGTSLLILVSVVLDTLQQIETHLLNRHYDGLTTTGTKIKGRNALPNM